MQIVEDHVGLTLDRIVFATDFSLSAQKAEGYALGLAKRFSSTLSFTHVAHLPIEPCADSPALTSAAVETRRTSARNQERLLREMTSAGVRTVAHTLEARNPAEAIVCFANELRADLIVTGTTQPHGLGRAAHGSCAEEMIRHAGRPVLTVGPNANPAPHGRFSFQTVVFATDFSSHVALQTAVALSFARESIAQIYLCHVLDHAGKDIRETVALELHFEEALQQLIPRSAYDWVYPARVVGTGDVAPGILELAERVHADLIVLGAKRSGTWYAHLVDGTVGQVLAKSACPVLTVCAM